MTEILLLLIFYHRNIRGTSKETQALITSSPARHGRALLEYTEKYNIDVEKVSQMTPISRPSAGETRRDQRQRKKSILNKGLITERNSRRTVRSVARNVTQPSSSICKPPKTNETENNR